MMTPAFEACRCTGRNLDKLLHPAILVLLARQSLHGYELVRRLAQLKMFNGQKPDPAGVYRLIRQMEKEALVRSTWACSKVGPAKRQIKLTAEGTKCLRQWGKTLTSFQEAIYELLSQIDTWQRR